MNWQTVKVGDLCNLVRGSSPRPKNDSRYYGGPVPRLMVADVTRDGFLVTPRIDSLTEAGAKLSRPVKAGTIVMAVSGNVGLMSRLAVDACIHDGFVGFVNLSEKVQPHYFMWLMTHLKGSLAQRTAGAIFQNTTTTAIKELEIPLPPLAEQERIAARLDTADRLRALRRDALVRLDALTHSLFLEMFGDPAHNPMDWPMVKISDICETRLGKMLDDKKQTGKDKRLYLRNANVQWNRFDLSSVHEMDFDEKDRKTFLLKPNDLLICEGGEPGRTAIWKGQIAECYYQKALHRVRPFPESANAEYLLYLMWNLAKAGKLVDHITAATIAHLTGQKLKEIEIPLPPLSLQQRFASRLGQIERVRADMERSRLELDALFASLQSAAFEGN